MEAGSTGLTRVQRDRREVVEEEITQVGRDGGQREYQIFDGPSKKKSACDIAKTGLKWTGVALAILGLMVGVVGLLVYLGQLSVALTGVGVMSATTGLYVMLAGFGVTFVTAILLGVATCLSKAKAAKDGEKAGISCFNGCGGEKKVKQEEIEIIQK